MMMLGEFLLVFGIIVVANWVQSDDTPWWIGAVGMFMLILFCQWVEWMVHHS